MAGDKKIWLSHTGIETLERCPRCFWLLYRKGIRQPEGIVSRLANRFDGVLKNYFASFRGTDELPPMVTGKLEGRLQYPFQEKYFAPIDSKYGFWGKLDECLINEKREYIPVDFKTSSSDPREREILPAYQSQIDAYVFLLQHNNKPVAGFGYLIFVYPEQSKELHNGFPMVIHITKLKGSPDKTKQRIAKAIEILKEDLPRSHPNCSFCKWYKVVKAEVSE